jgi:hypothetical protein
MFDAQWYVPLLRGQRKENKKHHFHLLSLFILNFVFHEFHSPLTYAFILPQFKTIILCRSFCFPWLINCIHIHLCTMPFTCSLYSWNWLNIFQSMVSHTITSHGPQITKMNEKLLWGSSLNLTLTQHPRDDDLILKLNPLELGIIGFFKIFIPWWVYCKSTLLLMMNPNPFAKVLIKSMTLRFSHGHWFPVLHIIIGCVVWFVN